MFDKFLGKAKSYHKEGLRLYFREGKYADAISWFDRAIESDPTMAYAWHDRGMCLRELGDDKEALRNFDRALELMPAEEEVLFTRADMLRRIGILRGQKNVIDAAVMAYNKVLEINPNQADAWNSLGICMKELGNNELSRQYYDRSNDLLRRGAAEKEGAEFQFPCLISTDGLFSFQDLSSIRWRNTMKSPVYFASLRAHSDQECTTAKVRRLFERAGFEKLIAPHDKTALKLHFGEMGNDGFISPVYVRQVVEKVKECGALPFLTDTNTLYLGSRSNAVEHITTAILHGFDYAVTGAPVIIADGLSGKNIAKVEIGKKHFSTVTIAGDIAAADSMIVLSHFKGHIVSGFGGAIKNLAMGCAPPEGKRAQHNARPFSIAGKMYRLWFVHEGLPEISDQP